MENQNPTQVNPESEDFLKGSPTREELNNYLNNVFMAVTNNFGVFQGYTVAALAATITECLAPLGSKITPEEFSTKFAEHNAKIIKQAETQMKEMEKQAKAKTAAKVEPIDSKEIDISVF
jgi:hypothetical protein